LFFGIAWYVAKGNNVCMHIQSTVSDLTSLKLTPQELVNVFGLLFTANNNYICLT